MSATCLGVGLLLQRRAAGLNEAERLVLEGHLSTCAECRAQGALLAGLRQLAERATEPGTASRAQLVARAIERAGRAAGATPARFVVPRSRVRSSLVLALAASLTLAAFAVGRAWHRAPEPLAAHALERSRLVSGNVSAEKRRLAPGDAIPVDEPLYLDSASALALEHAEVHAAEPSSGQWSASRVSFSLEHGALDVSVDPRPKRPFSVRTSRFAVEVLGTEFHVTLSGVRVSRGLVRVVSPTGEELARVAAGQMWQLAEPTPPLPPSDAPIEAVPAPRSAGESLVLARHALALHELSAAKQALASVPAAHPSWQEQAEAQMLLGDWARLSGDDARAAREYLAVSTRFRALPLAENALFSAARAAGRAGFANREQELLTQYLVRYPNGQFRREAEARRAGSPAQELK